VEHFVTIERAIACPRASVAVAADTAAQVLGAAGYRRGLGLGPTASYVRAHRPRWAVVLAVLGSVPTLGLSLLLLRVRAKDHCNVVLEDGPYGVVALVSGRVPANLPAALENASGQYVEQPAGGYPQQPPQAMLLSPSGGVDVAPSHGPQAILRPATPVPGMGVGPGQPLDSPGGVAPSFDPYPPPQHHQPPAPEWARRPDQLPDEQPMPAPARPPSKLAPSMPPDGDHEQAAARGGVPPAPPAPAPDEDPFSSTSGRVPWVGGGRPGPLPAPPAPAPVSPISRPPGFPPAPAGPPVPPAPAGPRGPQPEQPGRVATAVSQTAAPVLRVDTGEVLQLGPFCLLGREPVAREGDPDPTLVRLEDPKLSVSKTHMAYGVDAQGLWVMDRNSTNGTTIIDSDGRRTPCAPGNRQYVTPGFHVQIGQRRIVVEAPATTSA
jgi:hypothetical protein